MLKICNGHGMSIDNTHEIASFEQSERLEKYIYFDTTKRIKDKNEEFFKLLQTPLYGKKMEIVKKRTKIKFVTKDDSEKIFKQQSSLAFNGIQKSYTKIGSYTFQHYEVLMDKPIY